MINVCVFPAQNESAVEINNALSNCESINVFGIALIRGHNEFNFRNYYFGFPKITDEDFAQIFEQFILEHHIDVVFPTTDSTVVYFAQNKNRFTARIVNADYDSAVICNDKRKTYALFQSYDFCPIVYTPDHVEYPCFIKPADGEGAVGARIVKQKEDMPETEIANDVILEYLPGEEMTVDCISDKDGRLVEVLPRKREKVFSGMSVFGSTVKASEEILSMAQVINDKLKFRGLWYFQVKKSSSGLFKLLEISMRCAGTMCQTRARGYNLPLLSVYTALGKEISAVENDYSVVIDRTLFARYKTDISYNIVYIDYDGTIIVKGKVCLSVMRFLYQCKNENKRIVLISRHNEDHDNTLEADMKQHGISIDLFDEIVSLTFSEEKYSAITEKDAIFIDNSFFERNLS